MKPALLTLAVGILTLLFGACSNPVVTTEQVPVTPTEVRENNPETARSALYYLHRTLRCTECLSMELFSGALVQTQFEDALNEGRLSYSVVNLDAPEHAHYADDFNLTFSTLVLADLDANNAVVRWKELDEAWEKSLDQDAFQAYVVGETQRWLSS